MNIFHEYDVVISKKAFDKVPEGTRGAILMVYESSNEYEVEFVDENGDTLNVLTVSGDDIEDAHLM